MPPLVRIGWHRRRTEEYEAEKSKSECDKETTLEKKTAAFLSLWLLDAGHLRPACDCRSNPTQCITIISVSTNADAAMSVKRILLSLLILPRLTVHLEEVYKQDNCCSLHCSLKVSWDSHSEMESLIISLGALLNINGQKLQIRSIAVGVSVNSDHWLCKGQRPQWAAESNQCFDFSSGCSV